MFILYNDFKQSRPLRFQVFPLVWEVPLDDVYFDGVKLARSSLSSSNISLSALIDTVRYLFFI